MSTRSIFVAILFSFCLSVAAASEVEQWQRALHAWQEQRFADAQLIVDDMRGDGVELHWLRLRLALDVHDWQRCEALLAKEITGNNKYTGALYQCAAEYYMDRGKTDEALLYANKALRFSGALVNEAKLLRALIAMHTLRGEHQHVEGFARLLWRGKYAMADRVQGGLTFAQLVSHKQSTLSRSIWSEIRLLRGVALKDYYEATIGLINILLPEQALQAERVVISAMRRMEGATDEEAQFYLSDLQARHVLTLFHCDKKRALAMMESYGNEQHPEIKKLIINTQLNKRIAVERSVFQARALLVQKKNKEALALLSPFIEQDDRALCLAVDCGLQRSEIKARHVQLSPSAYLHLFMRAHEKKAEGLSENIAQEIAGRMNAWLDEAIKKTPSADLISVLLVALNSGLCTVAQEKRCEQLFQLYRERHLALALWYGKQAQASTSGQRERLWESVLKHVPVDHVWATHAAEQLALIRLRPIPVGATLHKMSHDKSLQLEGLIEHLSALAWLNDAEPSLRCRYLLGQALAQVGRLGEARICFESLVPLANENRKTRLTNALDRISAHASSNPSVDSD